MGVFVEKFADLKILKYDVPGFEDLSLDQKLYVYYLNQAALCGRDILWDQNNEYNLRVRAVLETIYKTYSGNRDSENFTLFVVYLKRVWFSNGIHHHYSTDKIPTVFPSKYFRKLVKKSDWSEFNVPLGISFEDFIQEVEDVIFNPEKEPKRVCLDSDKDIILASSNNYYRGVNQHEVEEFYLAMKEKDHSNEPVSYGLNSTLVKENNLIRERVWRSGGLYSKAIDSIIFWLEQAKKYAENENQKGCIESLVQYYRTGDLKYFDEYNIQWVKELEGRVDFVNGFIEVYGDAMGLKGSWESIVNIKDLEASVRADLLSKNAHWFEENSPVSPTFKKEEVKGVSAKVINVTILGGDCYPATPIGINLPNAEWIREEYGSKSVTIENITHSYFLDSVSNGLLEEFVSDPKEIERAKQYGYLAGNLHTDLHECLGHGSGRMMAGVTSESLKNYYSTIEETRADLFALYYILDEKLLELDLMPTLEAAKAEYDAYIRNGLITQLTRIEKGQNLEESHMRNRQLIAKWVLEKGKQDNVVELFKLEGKTYSRINDYKALRILFGELLSEVQRIKSEGDLGAARELVEKYGVIVDSVLHSEVIDRFVKLDLAPYAGFINPEYELVKNENGHPVDVVINYVEDYAGQMLNYSKNYSFLPLIN